MSFASEEQETVLVRDRDGVRQLASPDDWTTLTMLAALSADPRTFDEFAKAWLRYRPEEPLEDLPWTWRAHDEPPGPWFLLDLACLRVTAGGGAELPENPGGLQRDEGEWTPEMPVVWINLPPQWQCAEASRVEHALPPLPAPAEPLDARGVLFGRPLAVGIAQRTLQIARSEPLPPDYCCEDEFDWENPPTDAERETAAKWYELTVRVHADWLLTPRDDLEGLPPRHYLNAGRDWVDRELENRQTQWSNERRAPRALDRDAFAYRFGPVGRHEMVMYFDLCREVIGSAWERIVEKPEIDETALAAELYEHAQSWLAEGSIDGDPTPPATIIESERRRLPLVGDGGHFDCDCPICRMQAETDFGPMFRMFDGHHLELDEEFAFSFCETRRQWEEKQERYRRFNEEFAAREKERKDAGAAEFPSAWSSSYIDEDVFQNAGAGAELPLFALAARVGELVTDLKDAECDRELIDDLNRAFDAYRAVQDDPALARAAQSLLAAILEKIAAAAPPLTAKAADLQSLLDEHRRHSDFPS